MKAGPSIKQTNTGNWNEAVQHPSGEALQRSQEQPSMKIKHNRQHLTGARQNDRYNRRRSSSRRWIEDWMWLSSWEDCCIVYFITLSSLFSFAHIRWHLFLSVRSHCFAVQDNGAPSPWKHLKRQICACHIAVCMHGCCIHFQHPLFGADCRQPLLICCEQILEMAYE